MDYFGVFRNLRKALSVYAESTSKGEGEEEEFPVKEFEELLGFLEQAIEEGKSTCLDHGVDLQKMLDLKERGFQEINLFDDYANLLLQREEVKQQFYLYTNVILSLYDSAKPEIYSYPEIKRNKEVFEERGPSLS